MRGSKVEMGERTANLNLSQKHFEPKVPFVEGKWYMLTRKENRGYTRDTNPLLSDFFRKLYVKFLGVVPGEGWVKHYLFGIGGGARKAFTQVQLDDYRIGEE